MTRGGRDEPPTWRSSSLVRDMALGRRKMETGPRHTLFARTLLRALLSTGRGQTSEEN